MISIEKNETYNEFDNNLSSKETKVILDENQQTYSKELIDAHKEVYEKVITNEVTLNELKSILNKFDKEVIFTKINDDLIFELLTIKYNYKNDYMEYYVTLLNSLSDEEFDKTSLDSFVYEYFTSRNVNDIEINQLSKLRTSLMKNMLDYKSHKSQNPLHVLFSSDYLTEGIMDAVSKLNIKSILKQSNDYSKTPIDNLLRNKKFIDMYVINGYQLKFEIKDDDINNLMDYKKIEYIMPTFILNKKDISKDDITYIFDLGLNDDDFFNNIKERFSNLNEKVKFNFSIDTKLQNIKSMLSEHLNNVNKDKSKSKGYSIFS